MPCLLSLLHLFYIHHHSPFLIPLTNPSAVILPLALLHPLLSLTTQIHLVGFDNHFQSSAKILMNNAAKLSSQQHMQTKFNNIPYKNPKKPWLKINLPNWFTSIVLSS